jgi:CheY-like chemotaxis protein
MRQASILLVDDESSIRLMLRTTLESEGYHVEEAADGQEAFQALDFQAPDLLLLDLNMPKIDGIALLERLTLTADHMPRVVVLTAYGSIPTALKATRLGAAEFLEKPTTPAAVREAVRRALTQPMVEPMPQITGEVAGPHEDVLNRVRQSLRWAEYVDAERLLMKATVHNARASAECFNLLGVAHEAQRNWRLARKYYGKAMRADKTYQPPQLNMRRIYELYAFGRSKQAVALGDDTWDARMPQSQN